MNSNTRNGSTATTLSNQRKGWSQLSPGVRHRYECGGITRTDYERGVSLSAARGHAATPERPGRVESRPDRYRGYIATGNIRAGKTMRVITAEGVREMSNLSFRERSLVAEHEKAVTHYLYPYRNSRTCVEILPLASFDGKTVAGIPLATDPAKIESMAVTGEPDYGESLDKYDVLDALGDDRYSRL